MGGSAGLQISPATIDLRFLDLRQSASRFLSQFAEVERYRRPAGLALVPQTAQSLDVFPAKLLLELPIAQSFPHDLAGRRIFARFDGGLKGGDLLSARR